MNDGDLKTRQKALMALCDVVHDPENVTQTIKCGETFFVYIFIHISKYSIFVF